MNTPPLHHSHTRSLLAIVAVAIPAMLIGAGLSAPSARAAFTMTLEQQGTSVVATGSGSIDLTDLTFGQGSVGGPLIAPENAEIIAGPVAGGGFSDYAGFTGPMTFAPGTARNTVANSGSGDLLGVTDLFILVPRSYVSGSALSDSATWSNATFDTLGVTPDRTYTWTWGTGADADSFTVQIGPAAVPAPPIGRGLPVLLAVGGMLFGAKLMERGKRRGLQFR